MRDDITQPAKSTVTIAGREYDAHTGLPVAPSAPEQKTETKPAVTPATVHSSAATASHAIHSTPQKSRTLHRRATKKPEATKAAPAHQPHEKVEKRKTRRMSDVATHKHVQKHASATNSVAQTKPAEQPDTPAASHPAVHKAHAKRHAALAPHTKTAKSSQAIKKEAIEKAMNAPSHHHTPKKKNFFKRHPRIFSVASVSIALFALAAFLTYANFPHLQVKIAAAQAGIAASYPGVKPDGYHFNGPAEVSEGSVTLNFDSNTSDQSYSITQAASSWDSDAVRLMVEEASNDQFITTEDRGLTIYTYDGHAAWVNKEILYTIEGDAGFSSDYIARIASSF